MSLYIVYSLGYLDLVSFIESDNDVVGDALRVEGVRYPHTGEIGDEEKYLKDTTIQYQEYTIAQYLGYMRLQYLDTSILMGLKSTALNIVQYLRQR